MTTKRIPMRRADGTMDSVHFLPDASAIKPAADGTVLIPVEFVMALLMAGFELTDLADMKNVPVP
jgi:hypothetical protein